MSELKATTVYDAYWTANSVGEGTGIQVYLKSEADKVIAELKAQKAQAEDDCAYWKMSEGNAANAMHETEEYAMQLYKELRHQKFMRCNLLIDYCGLKQNTCEEEKVPFWRKWYLRWCELSDKFKEEK